MESDDALGSTLSPMNSPFNNTPTHNHGNIVRIASAWLLFSIIDCCIWYFVRPVSNHGLIDVAGLGNSFGTFLILLQFLLFTLQDLRRIRGPTRGLWDDVKLCFCGDANMRDILCAPLDMVLVYIMHLTYLISLAVVLWNGTDGDDRHVSTTRVFVWSVFEWIYLTASVTGENPLFCYCCTKDGNDEQTPLLG